MKATTRQTKYIAYHLMQMKAPSVQGSLKALDEMDMSAASIVIEYFKNGDERSAYRQLNHIAPEFFPLYGKA